MIPMGDIWRDKYNALKEETDRLRAELEDKNKLLDSCSMQLNETANERNSLRAELARRPTDVLCLGKHGQITVLTDCPECVKEELAKAQEENEKLRCRNKAQHAEIKATTAYSRGQDKALVSQQARVKELELSASEQYVKGMEESAKIVLVTKLVFGPATMEREAISAAYKAIRARIAELKEIKG